MKPGTDYTAEMADLYGVAGQLEGEPDERFRRRVAAELTRRGQLGEAHEALNNSHINNDRKAVEAGIAGAMARVMNGGTLEATSEEDVVEDYMRGVILLHESKAQ